MKYCPFMSSNERIECMREKCKLHGGTDCVINLLLSSVATTGRTINDSNVVISDIEPIVKEISKSLKPKQ